MTIVNWDEIPDGPELPASDIRNTAILVGKVSAIERALSFEPNNTHLHNMLWKLPVVYNTRLKNSAGRAGIRGIMLHPGLQQTTQQEFSETFMHEVAHCMEAILYHGKTGHGDGWWEAMIRLGEKPWITRKHSISSCMRRVA